MNETINLAKIAQILGAKLVGVDGTACITGLKSLSEAGPNDLSFFSNKKYMQDFVNTRACAVILEEKAADKCPVGALIVKDARLALAQINSIWQSKSTVVQGICPSVKLGANCTISPTASIAANCVIGQRVKIAAGVIIDANSVLKDNCSIEANSHIGANVVIHEGVTVGANVAILSGAIIGSRGFGFARDKTGWVEIPHLGSVTIADDVEIGANTTVDRGVLGDTIIGRGVKIDNLVQIAHNVEIGANTAIAACVGIAGSTKIGKNCLIGGQTGIAGHLTIADNVIITAKSAVSKNIDVKGSYSSGISTQTTMTWHRNLARLKNLDATIKKLLVLIQDHEAEES